MDGVACSDMGWLSKGLLVLYITAGVINLFHLHIPWVPLKLFAYPGCNFLNLRTSNIIICIPLCYLLCTLELFAYPLKLKQVEKICTRGTNHWYTS